MIVYMLFLHTEDGKFPIRPADHLISVLIMSKWCQHTRLVPVFFYIVVLLHPEPPAGQHAAF